jgi:hypothetical protein
MDRQKPPDEKNNLRASERRGTDRGQATLQNSAVHALDSDTIRAESAGVLAIRVVYGSSDFH